MANAPLAAVYATQQGSRLSLVVLSRKVAGFPVAGDDGSTPVTVDLPLERARSITLYRMRGAAEANNVMAQSMKVSSSRSRRRSLRVASS